MNRNFIESSSSKPRLSDIKISKNKDQNPGKLEPISAPIMTHAQKDFRKDINVDKLQSSSKIKLKKNNKSKFTHNKANKSNKPDLKIIEDDPELMTIDSDMKISNSKTRNSGIETRNAPTGSSLDW